MEINGVTSLLGTKHVHSVACHHASRWSYLKQLTCDEPVCCCWGLSAVYGLLTSPPWLHAVKHLKEISFSVFGVVIQMWTSEGSDMLGLFFSCSSKVPLQRFPPWKLLVMPTVTASNSSTISQLRRSGVAHNNEAALIFLAIFLTFVTPTFFPKQLLDERLTELHHIKNNL